MFAFSTTCSTLPDWSVTLALPAKLTPARSITSPAAKPLITLLSVAAPSSCSVPFWPAKSTGPLPRDTATRHLQRAAADGRTARRAARCDQRITCAVDDRAADDAPGIDILGTAAVDGHAVHRCAGQDIQGAAALDSDIPVFLFRKNVIGLAAADQKGRSAYCNVSSAATVPH